MNVGRLLLTEHQVFFGSPQLFRLVQDATLHLVLFTFCSLWTSRQDAQSSTWPLAALGGQRPQDPQLLAL